jgi:hypothetical protein
MMWLDGSSLPPRMHSRLVDSVLLGIGKANNPLREQKTEGANTTLRLLPKAEMSTIIESEI